MLISLDRGCCMQTSPAHLSIVHCSSGKYCVASRVWPQHNLMGVTLSYPLTWDTDAHPLEASAAIQLGHIFSMKNYNPPRVTRESQMVVGITPHPQPPPHSLPETYLTNLSTWDMEAS